MHGTIATSQRLQRTVSVYVHSLELKKGSILFVKMEGEMEEKLLRQAEENHVDEEINLKDKVWTETKKMWIVAGPAIFTRFSTFGMNLVSQAFVGHIGSTELAAYSLVVTVLLRFANGILLGMASALETLCGQAYGAQQYHMMGIYLQRSWIVLFICSIFLLPVFIFTTPILIALGQEREIAELAGVISYWLLPVMFAFIISFTCQMFLQAQSKNMIISYLAAFSFSIHLLLSWLLTVKYKFGITGAMVSTVMAYWIPNVGQLMFVMYGGCSETWKGFSIFAFKDLWPVMKLSLSSGAMLCLNVNGLEMMISLGFLAAASVRVSNELGRGSSKAAKFSIIHTYLLTIHEVARAVADLSLLLAFSILLNSVQPVLSGVAVGAGWQSIVAYVNLSCYYLIGIPVGVVLGYVSKFGVKGVWMGMLLGTFVQTVVLIIITWRTDWDKQVIIARKRLSKVGRSRICRRINAQETRSMRFSFFNCHYPFDT
ncbi:hypothetical protein Pint_20795 [Pistacia integerrima]|uniref:Uncharacterized protein n=1 Tax=Pistacia integerrima TaxID=434235 RepID=A0ACC0XAX7_9ROSI|nr:hypothetical protein Pint_20795 [Pistacia integerrima]